jgi:hypothetical protein
MQRVELVLDHHDFFCPVTGQRILGPEEFSPSPATAFVFPTQMDDFEFIRDEFARIDRKANTRNAMKDDPDGRFARFCEGLKGHTALVVFSITTRAASRAARWAGRPTSALTWATRSLRRRASSSPVATCLGADLDRESEGDRTPRVTKHRRLFLPDRDRRWLHFDQLIRSDPCSTDSSTWPPTRRP